jgi:hypothetical protein
LNPALSSIELNDFREILIQPTACKIGA